MVKRLIPAKSSEKSDKEPANTTDKASGGGFRQWLLDSYNGIFKILIQPQLPSLRLMGLLLVAFLFGLIWAYGIAPAKFYGAAPYQMNKSFRDQWVINVAGLRYADLISGDEYFVNLLRMVERPAETVQDLIVEEQALIAGSGSQQPTRNLAALQEIQPLAIQADPGRAAPKSGSFFGEIFSFILAIIVFLIYLAYLTFFA